MKYLAGNCPLALAGESKGDASRHSTMSSGFEAATSVSPEGVYPRTVGMLSLWSSQAMKQEPGCPREAAALQAAEPVTQCPRVQTPIVRRSSPGFPVKTGVRAGLSLSTSASSSVSLSLSQSGPGSQSQRASASESVSLSYP
jgi:hypothetical protein